MGTGTGTRDYNSSFALRAVELKMADMKTKIHTYFTGLVSIYSKFIRENKLFGALKTTLMLQS